jgi:hypothetical protein
MQFFMDQSDRDYSVLAFPEGLKDFGILYKCFVFELFSLKVKKG